MEKKTSQKILGLLSGLGIIGIGIFLIIKPKTSVEDLVILITLVLAVAAFMNLVSVLFKKKIKGQGEVLEAILNLGFAAFLFYVRVTLAEYIPFLFALWIIANAIIRFLSAITFFKDGVPNYGAYFVGGFISLILGIIMLISSARNFIAFGLFAGIYLIWFGVSMLFDTFNEEKTQQKMSQAAKKMQRKLRIAIPSLVGALLPSKLLRKYDEKIASEDANAYLQSENIVIPEKRGINPVNVEILIHLSKKFMESFGHVDLIFGDEAFSYGNFDGHSYRLGGVISDGVLFRCNRERYLQQSTWHDGKVLIAFKVAFEAEEFEQIRANYEHMRENMTPWFCDTQLMEQGLLPEGDYNDVGDIIYKGNDAQFYKFDKGTLKTYFAVDTNCVKVADNFFENTNFDKPAIPGIVTPGAYYKFLMDELERVDSKVYEKHIYSKETLPYDKTLETGKL